MERALDAGCEPISILVEDRHIKNQAKNIIERCGDIPIFTAPFDVLTGITGFKLTRGMLCAMHRPKLKTVEEICKDKRRVAVLENIMNPTNVGQFSAQLQPLILMLFCLHTVVAILFTEEQ